MLCGQQLLGHENDTAERPLSPQRPREQHIIRLPTPPQGAGTTPSGKYVDNTGVARPSPSVQVTAAEPRVLLKNVPYPDCSVIGLKSNFVDLL